MGELLLALFLACRVFTWDCMLGRVDNCPFSDDPGELGTIAVGKFVFTDIGVGILEGLLLVPPKEILK